MAPLDDGVVDDDDDKATTSTSTSTSWSTSATIAAASVSSENKQPSIATSVSSVAQGLPVIVKELIAGGAAGAVAKTCVAPLERVKILFQTGRMTEVGSGRNSTNNSSTSAASKKTSTSAPGKNLAKRGSISGTLASIARSEGLRGLFKGNGASVLRIVPYSALHFGAYEQYRSLLVSSLGLDRKEEEKEGSSVEGSVGGKSKSSGSTRSPPRVPATVDLLAGSAAGATAVLATYPLDLARTRLAYDMEGGVKEAAGGSSTSSSSSDLRQHHRHRHQTVRSVLRATVAQHGLRGLYCGIGPTLAGILPYAGLKFYVYQSAKHAHLSAATLPSTTSEQTSSLSSSSSLSTSSASPSRPSVAVTLAFGAAAGLVAQTATYPLDVVRRQMQVAGLAQAQAARASSAATATATTTATTTSVATAPLPPPSTTTATTSSSSSSSTSSMPRSTLAGLRSVWASGGLRAAFAGVSINYLKVVPSTAIGFSTYDALKSYLGLSHNL